MSLKREFLNQFIHEVRLMRQAQKDYFIRRTKSDLEKSKKYERRVDESLYKIFSKQQELEL